MVADRLDHAMVARLDLGDRLTSADVTEHRTRCRHHERVAVVGAEVEHRALGDRLHHFGPTAERADRQAAADRLGEAHQIGLHAEAASGAAVSGSDAGLHLVEDEHRAVAFGDLANGLEVAGQRRADADVLHHGLDDERSDLAPVRLEHAVERVGVVERDHDRVVQARPA